MATPSDVKSIFGKALELTSAAERAAYLDQACGEDHTLRAQVERLLGALDKAGHFMSQPAVAPLGTIPPVETNEVVGDPIGPYKLLQRLGEGGMGTVFLAEQQQPVKRQVALKIIKAGMDSRQIIARFEQERQALAMMDHPNIARVLDAGAMEGGRPYVVMELVKGVPITKFCDEQRLTPQERLELFIPVCQAVQHAHQKGIVHRDLKPSNVLIALYDGRPVPKVIDFGLAKAVGQTLTERTLFTEVGVLVGTLEYMAPEQAELNNLDIDTRADIYSLGVILYELLTGTTPLTSKQLRDAGFAEILRLIKEVEPPKPSTKLSSSEQLPSIAATRKLEPKSLTKLVTGELDWIVMKCLEKERTRRYETANALARDIQRYLSDEPVEAGPPSARYKLRKFARRHRRWITVGAAFALLLTMAAALSIALAVWALRERDIAIGEKQRANKQTEIADAVSFFLDKDLLFQAAPESGPNRNLSLRTVLDRASQRIEGRFPNQPLVEARLRFTLSRTYTGLGEYAVAKQHADRAFSLYSHHLGLEHRDTMTTANELIGLLYYEGKYNEARERCAELFETRRRVLGPDHRDTLMSMGNLADLLETLGRLDEAQPLHEQALATQRRTLGPHHADTLQSMNSLACVLRGRGRLADARKLHEETLELQREKLGPEHPHTLQSMSHLVTVLHQQGALSESLALGQQLLEIGKRVYGPEHDFTLSFMQQVGVSLEALERTDEARQLFEETLVLRRRVSPTHPATLLVAFNLAWTLATAADSEVQNPTRALELAKELVQLQPTDANYWSVVGIASYRVGEWQAAISALEKSDSLAPGKHVGRNGFFLAMVHWRIGDAAKAKGFFETADKWMTENQPGHRELVRFRAEAEKVLDLPARDLPPSN